MTENNSTISYVKEVCKNTSIALQLISRGKIWMAVSEKGVAMKGDKKGIQLIKGLIENRKLIPVLDYFGWQYETDRDGKVYGEGVIAFTLFSLLMGSLEPDDLKDFFKDLHFSLKK
jgi:hypothetical protein